MSETSRSESGVPLLTEGKGHLTAGRKRRRPARHPSDTLRSSQRMPQSCTECARRKIRCDKVQPCAACVERGEGEGCVREALYVKGALVGGEFGSEPITLEGLARELKAVKDRLGALESEKKRLVGLYAHGESSAGTSRAEHAVRHAAGRERGIFSRPNSPRRDSAADIDQGRLPGAIEEAALGIGETTRWMGSALLVPPDGSRLDGSSQWFQAVPLHAHASSLPSDDQTRALVHFYLDSVGWMTGNLHAASFVSELDGFCDRRAQGSIDDTPWLGQLFAVLCVAAYFLPDERSQQLGFAALASQQFAPAWFTASVASLCRHGIHTRPTLLACQTIQILGPAFHFTGNKELHQSLTAIERSHARALNLHLLGLPSQDHPDDALRKSLGRRVWWNLVEVDWSFLPYNRYCQVSAPHFDTDVSGSLPDEPDRIFRHACYRSSAILYDLYFPLAPNETPPYARVEAASQSMATLRNELTARLSAQDATKSVTTNTEFQLSRMTLSYRSYQIHRLYYIKAFNQPAEYRASRLACKRAAEDILASAAEDLPDVFHRLWNVSIMMVAAGIILAFEAIQLATTKSSSSEGGLIAIRLLIDRLRRLRDRSGIADRGATLIQHLLSVEGRLRSGQLSRVRFTRQDIFELVNERSPSAQPDPAVLHHEHPSGDSSYVLGAQPFTAYPHQDAHLAPDAWLSLPTESDALESEFDFASLLGSFMPQ